MIPDTTKYYKIIMPDGSYSLCICQGDMTHIKNIYRFFDIIKISKAKYDYEIKQIEKKFKIK